VAYRIKRANGTYEYGKTDHLGQTHLVNATREEEISIELEG
jgi:type VI secretion system secreted protein VgrG